MSVGPGPLVASLLAALLAAAMRLFRPIVAPCCRLWRLASLRASVAADSRIPVSTQFDGPVRARTGARIVLGDHCRLGREVFFETEDRGTICIGASVRINAGCVIVSHEAVTIGDRCLIGEYVSIRDADHGIETGRPIREQPHRAAAIHIGEGAWIGRGSVVLKGLSIGAGAVIGANSVVTRDVPTMAIVVGAPAKLVRMRTSAAEPVEVSL